jgi:hypothetical protein
MKQRRLPFPDLNFQASASSSGLGIPSHVQLDALMHAKSNSGIDAALQTVAL